MPRDRTPLEKAAGKLISAVQREWTAELGDPQAETSETVMHASHSLLQAASSSGSIAGVIGKGSVAGFLGQAWIDAHPSVLPSKRALEAAEAASSK
jgi:hypothetical protein